MPTREEQEKQRGKDIEEIMTRIGAATDKFNKEHKSDVSVTKKNEKGEVVKSYTKGKDAGELGKKWQDTFKDKK